MMALLKNMEKKLSSFSNEAAFLQKKNEKHMKKSGWMKELAGRSVQKLVKSVVTCFLEKTRYISRAISNWRFRKNI